MSLIEVLPPSSKSGAHPGWAYVPDTGVDHSKAALQPSGSRKRARNGAAIPRTDTTARQQNAILKRLLELDKENHRDGGGGGGGANIPVPVRARDGAGRVSKGKLTPAVRKILTSAKTFANYLADEEALASQPQPQSQSSSLPQLTQPLAIRASTPSQPMHPPKQTAKGTPSRQPSTTTQTIKPDPSTQSHSPYANPHPHLHLPPTPTPYAAPSTLPVIPNPNDPLLITPVPPLPSHALMNTLLLHPALSYHEARAAPSGLGTVGLGKGGRKFCEICGYWGLVKCLKCGARVCGLECLGSHEESRCLRFYG